MTAGFLTDVPGLLVGHHERRDDGWLTGTTVVLCPGGATGGVDVRGGGPGTRETDLLRPENLVQQVHAICLTGGSAFGLAACDGVMAHLAARGIGFRVGPGRRDVVPIVPGAVVFDLGRGGRFDRRPDARFGRRAAAAATDTDRSLGCVGAGTGTLAGGLKGGIGQASTTLPDGTVVAALAVVNASGNVIDPSTGLPFERDGIGVRLGRPSAGERAVLLAHLAEARRPLNTTIGVVATDARLTKAECTKLATVAHDGMARAVRPSHSMHDGDTVFALATGRDDLTSPAGDPDFRSPTSRAAALDQILRAGAECFARACTLGVLMAESAGGHLAYRDLVPSAFATRDRR